MEHLTTNIRTALYSIKHNKTYAAFCILGSALTFIFIILLLQLTYTVKSNQPPLVNADRSIEISTINDHNDKAVLFMVPERIRQLNHLMQGYENYSVKRHEIIAVEYGEAAQLGIVSFVNQAYWDITGWEFVAGREWSAAEEDNQIPLAVITVGVAKDYFGSANKALEQTIAFQGREYKVVGVVRGYSSLISDESSVFVSHHFNRSIPSGNSVYTVRYLFPESMSEQQAKQAVLSAVNQLADDEGHEVSYTPKTVREELIDKATSSDLMKYGVGTILIVLLIVPAVNIITLSAANANTRAAEIAVRRALGASKQNSFRQIMTENLLLVFMGIILGLVLIYPASFLIGYAMQGGMSNPGQNLVGGINLLVVILGVLPLALVFSLISGGIPAWNVSRRNIASTLKGEDENPDASPIGRRYKHLVWIYLEQALIFVVLMLCIVAVGKKMKDYYSPGLLDTENVMIFGYIFENRGASRETLQGVVENMQGINTRLKEQGAATAITRSLFVLPYIRPDADYLYDSLSVDGKKVFTAIKASDAEGVNVLGPEIQEGEWLGENIFLDDESISVVITRQLADSLGWSENIVGRRIPFGGHTLTVTGVISGLKTSAFGVSYPGIILPIEVAGGNPYFGEYGARVAPGAQNDFAAAYLQEFRKAIPDPQVEPIILDANTFKLQNMQKTVAPLYAQAIPTAFFLIFGFIGTVGLFWIQSKKRLQEFALRRAIGSTKVGLIRMVIRESVILTLLATIPGLILSVFIYNFTPIEVTGVGLTLIIMLIFSVFSAWYPAYKVSQASPAKALHYE